MKVKHVAGFLSTSPLSSCSSCFSCRCCTWCSLSSSPSGIYTTRAGSFRSKPDPLRVERGDQAAGVRRFPEEFGDRRRVLHCDRASLRGSAAFGLSKLKMSEKARKNLSFEFLAMRMMPGSR